MNLLPNKEPQKLETSPKPGRRWAMLLVLSLALAIIILDTTILNVALSSIIRDLGTTIQSVQWVITAYSLTLAALTITGGRLGDIFGRKRMFVFGAVLFAVGSFLASISTSVPMLIAGESIIEGIGAALMMPATASLLVANFQGRERAVAFGVWGGVAGAAAALGPIVGGFLTTHYTWRWAFRVNVGVVLLLLLGSVLITESRDTKEKPELDWVGVILSATGLLSFVFGVIEASKYGWWQAKEKFQEFGYTITFWNDLSVTPYAMGLGLLILMAFLFWERTRERRGHTPLISLAIFRNRQFAAGALTTLLISSGQTGLIFSLPVFLQAVRGLDAFQTGLTLLPMSLALFVISPLGALLSKKVPPKYLVQLGLLINVAAFWVLRATLQVDATRLSFVPGLTLFGVGMGLVMSQINNLTLSAVAVDEAGEASGINNTGRQIGATLGSAIIGTILLSTLSSSLVNGVNTSTRIPENMKPMIAAEIAKQTSNVEFGGGARLNENVPAAIREELVSISHRATVEANHKTLLYGSIFAFIGFLGSFLLPTKPRKPQELSMHDDEGGEGEETMNDTHEVKEKAVLEEGDSSSRALTTGLIAELIATDEKKISESGSGIYDEMRYTLDVIASGGSVRASADERLVQARRLWDAGWGKKLGFSDFVAYLATIPAVPFVGIDAEFSTLILVDARVALGDACALVGCEMRGLEGAALSRVGGVSWMRCRVNEALRGLAPSASRALFRPRECGLTEHEGLALIMHVPELLLRTALDLLEATENTPGSVACLGMWNGVKGLRVRWDDDADARFVAPTKLIPASPSDAG